MRIGVYKQTLFRFRAKCVDRMTSVLTTGRNKYTPVYLMSYRSEIGRSRVLVLFSFLGIADDNFSKNVYANIRRTVFSVG